MKISVPKQEFEINPEDLDSVQKFLVSVIPGFVKEFGGVVNDSVNGWRVRNIIQIISKTKDLIDKSGLTHQELSGKFIVHAIEKASVEDDETLQEKWAILLTNVSTGIEPDVKYISILSELSTKEARLLEALSESVVRGRVVVVEEVHGTHIRETLFSTQKSAEYLNISLLEAQIMIDNFYRLNICQPPAMESISAGGTSPSLRTNETFTFTDLDRAFLKAVKS